MFTEGFFIMRKKNIFASAFILTLAGIITKFLGFFYRIYMTNIIGAEGLGLYQIITPIYALAWSIACSGFTVTISKLVSAEHAKKEYGNMGRIVKQCIFITGGIGALLSVLIFLFADIIAIYLLKDVRVAYSLKILALCFPFMAIGSTVNGYFFGLQEAVVPATSQVLEQSLRIVTIFLFAGFFVNKGIEYAILLAVLGVLIGEFISCVYIVFSYKRYKDKYSFKNKPKTSSRKIFLSIINMATPLTLNHVTGSFLSTIENSLLPQRLQLFGLSSSDAMIAFGQLSGMAIPLIYFPTAFLSSLSSSLLPAVSEAVTVNKLENLKGIMRESFLFTSILSFGSACLFVTFSHELGALIYNQNISKLLFVLGLMCPIIYSQFIVIGILNGLGEQTYIFKIQIFVAIMTILNVYFLVPVYGMNAYLFDWFLTALIARYLYMAKLKNITDIKFNNMNLYFYPFLAAVGASGLTKIIFNKFISENFSNSVELILSAIILIAVYLFFIIFSGCVSIKDIKRILKI